MNQQDDITQPVLTDDEIREVIFNAIGFGFDPGELQSVNADDLMNIAHALLSKLRAPVADELAGILRDLVQHASEISDHTPSSFDTGVMRLANRARAALASAPVAGEAQRPTRAVWYGSMPESNGKSNWTAILYRKSDKVFDGPHITIDRSEYPDRVRYEADRMRYLIGEIDKEPWILDYDADKCDAAPQASAEPATYTTCPGESVMGIALRELGNEKAWRHILACNPQFADLLPHEYFPVGTVLTLPQADKDGGQQRAEDDRELRAAAQAFYDASKTVVRFAVESLDDRDALVAASVRLRAALSATQGAKDAN